MRLIDRLERHYGRIVAEANGDGGEPETAEGAAEDVAEGAAEPTQEADAAAGTFVSDTKLAEFAKTLIDAYLAEPPKREEIPSDMLNVTTRNSSAVIEYIRNLLALNRDISTEGGESEIENQIKQVPN